MRFLIDFCLDLLLWATVTIIILGGCLYLITT